MDLDRRQFVQRSVVTLVGLTGALASTGVWAQESWFDLRGDDGGRVANAKLPTELTGEIGSLPGMISAGASSPTVSLYEFYDYNCPYCPAAVGPMHDLLATMPGLRVGLINNPILSQASVEAARFELAVLEAAGGASAYEFHRGMFAARGVRNAARAASVAQEMGLPTARLVEIASGPAVRDRLAQQMKLAADLGLSATPAFVAGSAGVSGFPGARTLAKIANSLDACGEIVCP